MRKVKSHGGNIILLSFVAAFILSMVPLPHIIQSIRPEFVLLVLIYWCIALPERISVGIGWVVGIFYDVAIDSLLGQHALTFALVAYLSIQLHQRIRVFPIWQQAITVFIFMMLQGSISLWIKGMIGDTPPISVFIWPAIMTAMFWPVAFVLMRQVRRYYQIN